MSMRSEFDLDSRIVYLNSGTHSICPRSVLEAVTRYQREYELNPTLNLFRIYGRLWEVQSELARFLGARPEDLFLRANVTEPLNIFIQGMDFGSGEILVSDLEYGAIANVCAARAKRRNLSVRKLHLPTGTADVLGAITGAITPDTKMLVLSHVMTGTGLVLPLRELARETRKRGILLVIDGAHGPGAVPLNFAELDDLDFYGGNLHKWMMAPKGTAFGWAHPRHHEKLDALLDGWTSFVTPHEFAAFGPQTGDRFHVRLLMQGCHDYAPFLAIHDTLAFWKKHGAERIRGRIAELQRDLEAKVARSLGARPLSPPEGPGRGPLLSYELPPHLEKLGISLMFRLIEQESLQIAIPMVQGKWTLRLSPHIYNTEDESSRAVEILRSLWEAR